MLDWTTDRNVWSFKDLFIPIDYRTGLLAEDWETPDPLTLVVNLRDNVYWQNKPPANGRKLTAADVKYHYDRFIGLGEFSTPSPFAISLVVNIESVTAPDDNTVVFKFKKPSVATFDNLSEFNGKNMIESKEAVLLEPAGIRDWKNSVGTGPWILTDYVSGNVMTFERNPNYWGYDERHSENRLPYVDTLKYLMIPDNATALSALRTGKIQFITSGLSWQDADNLGKTNPELQLVEGLDAGFCVIMRCDKIPFEDIRVRKALQMSIDREAITKTHYGGKVNGLPCGIVSPALTGWCYAYNDWPQQLKDEYSYNPTRAKQLLAEAGFPKGFNTNVVAISGTGVRADINLLQIIKAYFTDVGVNMEINAMDEITVINYANSGKHDQMLFDSGIGSTFNPNFGVLEKHITRKSGNYSYNSDPAYDAIYEKFMSAQTVDEFKQYCVAADKFSVEQHWSVNVTPVVGYRANTPDIKGYSGELLSDDTKSAILTRVWREQ